MPIDLDLFVFQLSDLAVCRHFLRGAVGALKAKGALRGFFSASSGVPGSPEEEALDPEERKEARTERRLREMLARTSYVFGWSCLKDLLEQCVREVLQAHPQRVLAVGDWWHDGRLVRKQVVGGWSRDRVLAELVETAARHFRAESFAGVPKYFAKRLEVPWREEWQSDLLRVVNRRNEAAHGLQFREPPNDEVEKDLRAVLEHGEAIARAVAAKHHLECHAPTLDEMRYGPFEE
jgi:hypothetical protein